MLGAEDEALLPRLQGQTVDLPLRLRPRRAPGLIATPEDERDFAQRLRDPAEPDLAILWFRHQPTGATRVLLLRGDVLVQRVVDPPKDASAAARSAHREEVALVARSLLRAPLALSPSAAPPLSPLPAPSPQPAPPPPRAPRSIMALYGALGWSVATDGASPVQQGPLLQLGLSAASAAPAARWSLQVALTLAAALPAHLRDAFTEIALSRQALGVEVAGRRRLGSRWLLGAGLFAAAALYERRTSARDPHVLAAPPGLSAALLLSPGLRAAVRLAPRFYLELSGAADLVLHAPQLVYARDGDPSTALVRATLWPAQPRFSLALVRISQPR